MNFQLQLLHIFIFTNIRLTSLSLYRTPNFIIAGKRGIEALPLNLKIKKNWESRLLIYQIIKTFIK